MSVYLTLPKAIELMEQYNQEPFHRYHAQVVSGVLGYFAKEYDPENEEHITVYPARYMADADTEERTLPGWIRV